MMVAENTQVITKCRFCHSQNMVPANCATFECYMCHQRQDREQQQASVPEVGDAGGGILSGLKSGWRKAKQGIKDAVGADVGRSHADEEREREAQLQAREEAELAQAIKASLADAGPPQFASSSSHHDVYLPSYVMATKSPIAHATPSQHATTYPSMGPPPAFATQHMPSPNVPRSSTESSYTPSSYMTQTNTSGSQVSQIGKKQYDPAMYNTALKSSDSGGGPPLYNASAYSGAGAGSGYSSASVDGGCGSAGVGGYGGPPPASGVVIASSTPAVTAAVCQQCHVMQNWLSDGDKQNERLREQLRQAQLDLEEQKEIVEKLKSEVHELERRAAQPVQQAQAEESVVEQLLQRIEELEAQLLCATNFAQPSQPSQFSSESEHEVVAQAKISYTSAAQQSSEAPLTNPAPEKFYALPADAATGFNPCPKTTDASVVAAGPLPYAWHPPGTQGTPTMVVAEGVLARDHLADTPMVVATGAPYIEELPTPPPPVMTVVATRAAADCAENVVGGAATASTTGATESPPRVDSENVTSGSLLKALQEARTSKDASFRAHDSVHNATAAGAGAALGSEPVVSVATDGATDLPVITTPSPMYTGESSSPGSSLRSAPPMTGTLSCMTHPRVPSDAPVPTVTIAGQPSSQMVYSGAGDMSPVQSTVPISVVTVRGVLPQAASGLTRVVANPSMDAVASMATGSTNAGDTCTFGSPLMGRLESGMETPTPRVENTEETCATEAGKNIVHGEVEDALHSAEKTFEFKAPTAFLAERKEIEVGTELNGAELKNEKAESVAVEVEDTRDDGSNGANPTGGQPEVEEPKGAGLAYDGLKEQNSAGGQPDAEESKDEGLADEGSKYQNFTSDQPEVEKSKDESPKDMKPIGVQLEVEESKDEGSKDVRPSGAQLDVEESEDEGPKDVRPNGVQQEPEEPEQEGPKDVRPNSVQLEVEEPKDEGPKDGRPNGVQPEVEKSKDKGPKDVKPNSVQLEVEESEDEGPNDGRPNGVQLEAEEPKHEGPKGVKPNAGHPEVKELKDECPQDVGPTLEENSAQKCAPSSTNDVQDAMTDTCWAVKVRSNPDSENDKASVEDDKARVAHVSASHQDAGGSADDTMSCTV